jgi:putative transposase
MHKQYPTDLTDNEWEMIQHFFKKRSHRGGHPYIHSKRDIVDAIFYVLRSGCAWRLLPHDFPCWSTVYEHFRNWETQGIWERINAKLVKKWREASGRKKNPSGAIIDSQSVRTTEKGVQAGDMMEQKRSKEEKDISSLTRKDFCSRQKLQVLTLAIKKARSNC